MRLISITGPWMPGDPDVQEIVDRPECNWISADLEAKAVEYVVSRLVPTHLDEVRSRKVELLSKTEAAVKERLTKEIAYWDHRAADLQMQERAGKPNARLNSNEARRRADDLQARLQKRMEEIQRERQLAPLPSCCSRGCPSGAGWAPTEDDRGSRGGQGEPRYTSGSGTREGGGNEGGAQTRI